MKNKLYLLGGAQKGLKATSEYHQFGKGMIVELDCVTGEGKVVFEYVSPKEFCAFDDDPSITFKAGYRVDNTLYVCTQTEVLVICMDNWEIKKHISHPWLNDVHHVIPSDDDTIVIANTGLDSVLKLDMTGEMVESWSSLERDTWERFDKSIDYRKVLTTKPHEAHPNYVFEVNNDIYCTRFNQKDAICVTAKGYSFDIEVGNPHDGVLYEGKVYFTTTNGKVVIFDAVTRDKLGVYDLVEMSNKDNSLGWCRSIYPVSGGDKVWVAFSRLRETKWKENVKWLKQKLEISKYKVMEPTRIALFDLKNEKLEKEINAEPYGLSTVFSIL